MSYTETHIGKLRKVEIEESLSVEDWCRNKLQSQNIELSSYNKSWEEQLRDKFYDDYIIINDQIWEIFDHKEYEDDDIFEMIKNEDGTISFTMKFYNGGTCLYECLEEGISNINK